MGSSFSSCLSCLFCPFLWSLFLRGLPSSSPRRKGTLPLLCSCLPQEAVGTCPCWGLRRCPTGRIPHSHPEPPSLFPFLSLQVGWVRLPFCDCTLCSCSLFLSLHIPCMVLALFRLPGIFLCLHGLTSHLQPRPEGDR